jgi:serine/threonine protein kinase
MLRNQYIEIHTQGTLDGFKIGKYVMTKKLGQGSFSTVYLARDTKANKHFACKKMPRKTFDNSAQMKRLLDNEASIMQRIHHPNILHVHDMFITDNNYYLITDFCDQGDLDQFMNDHNIRFFEEHQAVGYLRQLMNGFVELRRHQILHRDLKLANIYINKGSLVIGDFGFAKVGKEIVTSKLGTPMTMAPEVLFPNPGSVRYNSKADLWSIGVIYYQLLFGDWPFWGNNQEELKQNILANSDKKIAFPRPISNESKDLLQRLLTFYPKSRIDWKDFFSHPIFLKFPDTSQFRIPSAIKAEKPVLDDVNFFDDTALSTMELPKIAKNAAEDRLEEADELESFNQSVIKEVYYRYSHEINKVYFLIFASHKISEAMKARRFHELDGPLMNLAFLSVLKALTSNKILIETCKTHKNIYRLDEEATEMFFKSPYANTIVSSAEKNSGSLKQHYQLLGKRAEKNNLEFRHASLVSSGRVTLAELEAAMEKEIKLIDSANLQLREERSKQFQVLRLILHLAQNSSRVLGYISDKTGAKMDWGILYFKLETSNSKEIRAMF